MRSNDSKYKTDNWTVLLVNLETGETMECDPFAVRSQGVLAGYKLVDEVTTDEWIDAIKLARTQWN